ncbi:MAG: transposase, partial [Verrucomicrobia bacterium]|nr:transposase [Verrucomicrobiota bacterium]
EKKELSDRRHSCLACGYQTSRDHNAAQNILALGLDGLGHPLEAHAFRRGSSHKEKKWLF